MIRAYHQVGTDSMEPRDRENLLKKVMEIGSLLPAVERVSRAEMEAECFGSEREVALHQRFRSSPETLAALRDMAGEWTRRLPEEGSVHTMFNCVDILAGDLGRLFLSVGDWYTVPTGFVFDAEELVEKGAAFRPSDMLRNLDFAVENAVKERFRSVGAARKRIEQVIDEVVADNNFYGKEAVRELRHFAKKLYGTEELVWEGRLPLDLAVEAWSEGRRIRLA